MIHMKTRLMALVFITILILPFVVQSQGISPARTSMVLKGVRDKLPVISTKWAQGCLYNAGCPIDTASHTTCLHVPAGPGAVAMAQIMKYYQYPAHGTGEHGYPHPKYGIQYANFGSTNYNWAGMPDSLNAGNDGLATLIYQCAVAQNMNFGSAASASTAADLDSALVKYFSYPATATWKSKSDYGAAEWLTMLKAELDASHPVIYSGTDISGADQQFFICDGYQGYDLFHVNWGFGGASDGYFSLDNLKPGAVSYSYNQQALFGLAPSPPNPGNYVMDFETVANFSFSFNDWTVNDADLHDTYGITGYSFPHQTEPMAFISFNPALVTPSMAADQAIQPHAGLRFGACFSSNPPSNSDWFISPHIQLGTDGSFSFWVKSYNDTYGLDTYTVAVSTTGNTPGSFTVISGTQPLATTTSWAKKTFNLSAYNNQQIYIAIHCVSNDNFLMMIDDLEVKPQTTTTLIADFSADKVAVRVGDSVSFTDQSSGIPVSWSWRFNGGNPGSSGLQNPHGIRYNTPGIYPVSLKVTNATAADSIVKTAFITVTGYPTTMSLDFESLDDFTKNFNPWILLDVNGGNTYGIQSVVFPYNYQPMAYICFNPSKTTPALVNMLAHSGQKLGCSFSSTPPMNPNNKWLISPKMSLGENAQVSFWTKTYNNQFGDEKYNVAVSNTDLSSASFVPLTALPEASPADWTQKTYSLAAYVNQDVYIGIQCVTNDGFIFMVDDISITSSLGINESNPLDGIVAYPNPAKDFLTVNCPGTGLLPLKAELISILGEKVLSSTENPATGRLILDVSRIPGGVYLLRLVSGTNEAIRKVSIIH